MKKMKFAVLLSLVFALFSSLANAQSYIKRLDAGTSAGGYINFSLTQRTTSPPLTESSLAGGMFYNLNTSGPFYMNIFGATQWYRIGFNGALSSTAYPLPPNNGNADTYTYAYPTYGLVMSVWVEDNVVYLSCVRTPPPQ